MTLICKKILAALLLLLSLPFLVVLYLVVKFTSRGPFIFKQKRAGRNLKPFTFFKVRTMVVEAERIKKTIAHLNEADGPAFKIRNDPRYTTVGKFISHTGLDEIPQLVNIIRGEMDFVGPRPLPVSEAKKVPKKYMDRFKVMPGMTSPWIVKGAHKLKFTEWMELDLEYAKNKNVFKDALIFVETAFVIISLIIRKIFKND